MANANESEAVAQIRSRLGKFRRLYSRLADVLGSVNAAVVFDCFMWHEDDRLRRGAQYFALTDPDGAEECGIGLKPFRAGRDLLCDSGLSLFRRQRLSAHGVAHYQADHDRIQAWLDANGFELCGSVPKRATDQLPKRQLISYQNGNSFSGRDSGTRSLDDDDARVRARDALVPESELIRKLVTEGVQEPTLSRLARQMSFYSDALEGLQEESDRLMSQLFVGDRPNKRIKSGVGLLISRLRQRYPMPAELVDTTEDA